MPKRRRARRFFEGLEPYPLLKDKLGWMPNVDIAETADELIITAELPGLAAKGITVRIENGMLNLAGEKKGWKEETEEKRRSHLFDRFYGAFNRTFALPRAVDPDNVTAKFADGVLTITVMLPEAKGRDVRTGPPAPKPDCQQARSQRTHYDRPGTRCAVCRADGRRDPPVVKREGRAAEEHEPSS